MYCIVISGPGEATRSVMPTFTFTFQSPPSSSPRRTSWSPIKCRFHSHDLLSWLCATQTVLTAWPIEYAAISTWTGGQVEPYMSSDRRYWNKFATSPIHAPARGDLYCLAWSYVKTSQSSFALLPGMFLEICLTHEKLCQRTVLLNCWSDWIIAANGWVWYAHCSLCQLIGCARLAPTIVSKIYVLKLVLRCKHPLKKMVYGNILYGMVCGIWGNFEAS